MKKCFLSLHLALISVLLSSIYPVGIYPALADAPPLPKTSSVAGILSVQSPDYHSCGEVTVPVINQQYEQEVVVLVNQERAKLGLPPLKRVDLLDQAARYHSADLGQDDYFEHDSYDRIGEDLNFVCLWFTRVQSYYPAVRAENIAAGYATPASVVQAWMESPGHRQNILSAYSDEIGVGYYQGEGHYSSYWTQDFGDRSEVYPLVINGEAPQTESRDVSLYIYGKWDEMRLRNNDDPWSAWQPFQNTLDWQLPMISGEQRVSVEMRDANTSTTSSDTIMLSAAPAEPVLGNLPDTITFTYSLQSGEFVPKFVEQTPLNTGNLEPLDWEITDFSPSLAISPIAGTTPQAFVITPSTIVSPALITSTQF
ncbi:MAG: CAP domain-containing protein, partial [Anaerolineales bacterium]